MKLRLALVVAFVVAAVAAVSVAIDAPAQKPSTVTLAAIQVTATHKSPRVASASRSMFVEKTLRLPADALRLAAESVK